MSSERKVVFLLLLLIILIVSCVYTHAPKLLEQSEAISSPEPTSLEVKPTLDNVIEENNKIELEKEDSSSENFEENIQIQDSEKENVVTTNSVEEKDKVVKEEIVEEEIIEPLLRTPDKYIRENDEKRIEELSMDAQKLQLEINDYIKKYPVIFKRAGYKTTQKSDKTIKMVAELLKTHPNIRMEIAGHTDAAGEAIVNQQISFARAKTVKDRLVFFGIDENRLIARGYGEDIPLQKNSPLGYSRVNRRVEFNIIEE